MLKILITGGSGFLGSHLADRLLARSDEVLVIDNYATGRRDNLTPQRNLTIIEGSICDELLMAKIFEEFHPQVVVHTAASYKDPNNYTEDVRTNVLGTAVVVNQTKRVGARRLIYFQTALCYGDPIEQPITLAHPINPGKSSYAISKTAGEMYIQLAGIDFISFRLANAYGPRNVSGPLPTFFSRLTTGKPCFVSDTRRDFIYVQDLIDIVEKAVDGQGKKGAYHISSGKDFSIKELFDATVHALEIHLDKPVEIKPRSADDVPTILLDPSKTLRDFGTVPSYPLTDGVRNAIRYYQQFGIAETFTHLKQN
ncbi:MAG: NAD-dependent epimerase/dehydratase family protein [Candidatus Omnitrophica bacterium]|nr:NAD-dependent epimerase/dehydratase family protein [Candidatus Omnitrophota bacterium]